MQPHLRMCAIHGLRFSTTGCVARRAEGISASLPYSGEPPPFQHRGSRRWQRRCPPANSKRPRAGRAFGRAKGPRHERAGRPPNPHPSMSMPIARPDNSLATSPARPCRGRLNSQDPGASPDCVFESIRPRSSTRHFASIDSPISFRLRPTRSLDAMGQRDGSYCAAIARGRCTGARGKLKVACAPVNPTAPRFSEPALPVVPAFVFLSSYILIPASRRSRPCVPLSLSPR